MVFGKSVSEFRVRSTFRAPFKSPSSKQTAPLPPQTTAFVASSDRDGGGVAQMVAVNRSCSEPDAFAGDASMGVTLPFLPTLVVAACVALATLCGESPRPSAPIATISSQGPAGPLPRMVRMGAAASDRAETFPAPHRPAVVAFAGPFPLVPDAVPRAEPQPAPSPVRPVRAARPHSGCPGRPCRGIAVQTASSPLRRLHPGIAPDMLPSAAQPLAASLAEPALPFAPNLAPPLAPTLRAIRRTVGFVGSQASAIGSEASALGGAVVDLVGGLR